MRVLAASLAIVGAWAQVTPRQVENQFRADTGLVLVPVTVVNFRGAIVNGLAKQSFEVLDNGQPQPIKVFHTQDADCSIGVVLDISGSMRSFLDLEKAAVHAFLRASNPGDDFFLVTVSSDAEDVAGPVEDVREIDHLAQHFSAEGGTALIDTVYLALKHPRLGHKNRRALLVISDGMDNNSRYSRGELMRTLVESDTQVYTIAVTRSQAYAKGLQTARVQGGLAFMRELAEKSGGVGVRLTEAQDPAAAAVRLSSALRNQYVIGYYPQDEGQSGKWHKIKVKVDQNKTNVYARSGYRLP